MKNNFIEHLNAHLDNQTKTIDSIKSTTRTVEGTCGRAYMHAVGLSAQKIGDELGISRSTINRFFRGEAVRTVGMIRFGVRRCCEDAYDVGLIPIEVSIKASESVESIENAIAQIDTFETELDKISEPYEEELESDEPLQTHYLYLWDTRKKIGGCTRFYSQTDKGDARTHSQKGSFPPQITGEDCRANTR